jgi:hypothetical protein
MEEMKIKRSEAGCGLERPWEGGAAIIFSGENQRIFVGGGVRKEGAICGGVIEYDCSTQLSTSSTQQSNGDDVGNGNGKDVASYEEGDGEVGKSDGDGNKGGAGKQQRGQRQGWEGK